MKTFFPIRFAAYYGVPSKVLPWKKIPSICFLVILCSCAPKISTSISKTYTPIDYREDIHVYGLNAVLPKNFEELGTVKIGDTGFTLNIGLDGVIDKAKMEARKIGGNAIKITNYIPPGNGSSSCHRITAVILKVAHFEPDSLKTNADSNLIKSHLALLHVYRPAGPGKLVNYELHLGDSTLCDITNNMEHTFKIGTSGVDTLWARTEVTAQLPVNFRHGIEYYLKCGVSNGAFIGNPSLELVDNKKGAAEVRMIELNLTAKEDTLMLCNGQRIECKVTGATDKTVFFTVFKDGKENKMQLEKSQVESIRKSD